MATHKVLYTKPAEGRSTYFRSGIAFPTGKEVEIDRTAIGDHAWQAISTDPRLKVSEVSKEDIEKAAQKSQPDPTEPGAEYRARVRTVIEGLMGQADAFTKAGLPKVAAVSAALEEADREPLTAAIVEGVWAEMRPPA